MALSSIASKFAKKTTKKSFVKFEGHTNSVSSVTFSPNGQYVLTGSDDRTTTLWDVKDGTLVHKFLGHTNWVSSVAFSPNGQYVLTGSHDKTAKLWTVKDGVVVHTFQGHKTSMDGILVHTFQGHTTAITSVAFSPNGQQILTGSFDRTAKLWNVKDGTIVREFRHEISVLSVAFSPNGQYVLTGSDDKTATLWSVKDGTRVQKFQGHAGYVVSVAFSPNGQYILTGSNDKDAKLWNVKDGTVVHTFQKHVNHVVSVAFSPNGQYVLTGSWDGSTKLWSVKDGRLVHTFHGHTNTIRSVAFSPSGQYALTGSGDNTARLWKIPKSFSRSPYVTVGDVENSENFTSNNANSNTAIPSTGTSTPNQSTISTTMPTVSQTNQNQINTNNNTAKPSNSTPALNQSATSTNMAVSSLNSQSQINTTLIDEAHRNEQYLLDLIHNTNTMVMNAQLLAEYPEELKSLLYEKSQSNQEKKELESILDSHHYREFYIHLVRKLNGMMNACNTIDSGMVTKSDGSFQDYVHDLIKEGTWTALSKIDLGNTLSSVIEWAKKQIAIVPFTDAIGSFFQIVCSFKNKRDQYLAIGRVAFVNALADIQEHGRGGVNGTVQRIARTMVRVKAFELEQSQRKKTSRINKLYTKIIGTSESTPAKQLGCEVADLIIGVIMKPKEHTELFRVLNGQLIKQSSGSLDEIIVAAALDIAVEYVQNLEAFSVPKLSNMDNDNESKSNVAIQHNFQNNHTIKSSSNEVDSYTINASESDVFNQTVMHYGAETKDNHSVKMLKRLEELERRNEMVEKRNEMLLMEVEKLKNKNIEVDGGPLAQMYETPFASSAQQTTMARLDILERGMVNIQDNLLQANEKIVQHDELLGITNAIGVTRNTGKKKEKSDVAKELERAELFQRKI